MLIQILMIFVCYAAEYVERVLDPSVRYRSEALVTENRMYHGQKPVDDRLQYCEGYDGRSRVQDTVSWPHSCTVRVDMKFRNASGYGSGMMIGPCQVLTCAHNVFNKKDNLGWAIEVFVTPALNGVYAPFGVIPCSRFYVFSQWINAERLDIALIILSRSIGYQTGWAGLYPIRNKRDMLCEPVTITQYPSDKMNRTMWTMEGKVSAVDDDHLYYPIDTWQGSSGSGVYFYYDNAYDSRNKVLRDLLKTTMINEAQRNVPYAIGVHIRGSENAGYNIGTRLTVEVFDRLIEWMSASWDLSESIPRLLPANSVLARSLAEQGDREAQYRLGLFYISHLHDSSIVAALKWLKKSADQNHSGACYMLGKACEENADEIRDIYLAFEYYHKALELGHPLAEQTIANLKERQGLKYSLYVIKKDKEKKAAAQPSSLALALALRRKEVLVQ